MTGKQSVSGTCLEHQTHPEPCVTARLPPHPIKGEGKRTRVWSLQGLPFAQAVDVHDGFGLFSSFPPECVVISVASVTQSGFTLLPQGIQPLL